jgi:hypothetical protein
MSKEASKNKNSQRKTPLSLIYKPELFDNIDE